MREEYSAGLSTGDGGGSGGNNESFPTTTARKTREKDPLLRLWADNPRTTATPSFTAIAASTGRERAIGSVRREDIGDGKTTGRPVRARHVRGAIRFLCQEDDAKGATWEAYARAINSKRAVLSTDLRVNGKIRVSRFK